MIGGGWSRPRGEGLSVPVELRFIDLYMAALGALLFLAMLFAYLLPIVPAPRPDRSGNEISAQPFSIATTSLPSGVVGIAYRSAIAYRGGTGLITWDLSSGQADLPAGLSFDKVKGVLQGTPAVARTSRIVIRAVDSSGAVVDQPYEILFQPPPAKLERAAWWVVAAAFLGTLIYAFIFMRGARNMKGFIASLREIYNQGNYKAYTGGDGPVKTEIELPEGIATYEEYYNQERRKLRFTLFATAGFAAYLVYLWLRH